MASVSKMLNKLSTTKKTIRERHQYIKRMKSAKADLQKQNDLEINQPIKDFRWENELEIIKKSETTSAKPVQLNDFEIQSANKQLPYKQMISENFMTSKRNRLEVNPNEMSLPELQNLPSPTIEPTRGTYHQREPKAEKGLAVGALPRSQATIHSEQKTVSASQQQQMSKIQEINLSRQRQASIIHDILPAQDIKKIEELQRKTLLHANFFNTGNILNQFRRDSVMSNKFISDLRRASVVTQNFQGNIQKDNIPSITQQGVPGHPMNLTHTVSPIAYSGGNPKPVQPL